MSPNVLLLLLPDKRQYILDFVDPFTDYVEIILIKKSNRIIIEKKKFTTKL